MGPRIGDHDRAGCAQQRRAGTTFPRRHRARRDSVTQRAAGRRSEVVAPGSGAGPSRTRKLELGRGHRGPKPVSDPLRVGEPVPSPAQPSPAQPAAGMRRAGLGEGAAAGNYGYANSGYSVHEEENERLTESLRTKVTAIKSLSIEIGTEVKNQNKMLSDMDSDFDSAGGILGATMGRLKTLSRGSQTKLLCYMMLFSLFVFFVIYWIIKLR